MKRLFKKEYLQITLLILIIGLFGVFYWQTVMSLPLFGDATIHGYEAKTLVERGINSLTADYPPFYSFIMAEIFSIFGEKGFNLVPYIGFIFLLISTFLFVKQITKNYYISLLAIIFIASSPKVIYYSARMYQEILLSAFFIFSTFLLFKYLEDRKRRILILLLFFIGITLSIKQQGLFILYLSISTFFVIDFLRKKISFVDLSFIFLIPIMVGLPFYGVLFHTKGEIQPGSNEFEIFKVINNAGQKIFFYTPEKNIISNEINNNNLFITKVYATSNINRTDNLENELEKINTKYSNLANARAENRHIWPTDVFLNFDKFNQANSLYLPMWQGLDLESPILYYFSFIFLIGGFFYCLLKYKSYSNLLIFTVIFLPNNYILFIRNNDQQRYQLFIPIFLTVFICILSLYIFNKIIINKVNTLILISISLILFIPILSSRIQLNESWVNSQIYSPSIGGIPTIQEAGSWLNKKTNSNTIIGQACGDEIQYYSDRHLISDWRVDFLDKDSLKSYFNKNNISYYIIFKSQLVDDNQWTSLCWIPNSFYKRMEANFSKAYITKSNDIVVYNVQHMKY